VSVLGGLLLPVVEVRGTLLAGGLLSLAALPLGERSASAQPARPARGNGTAGRRGAGGVV
jgi:hypothetical protein